MIAYDFFLAFLVIAGFLSLVAFGMYKIHLHHKEQIKRMLHKLNK